VSTMDVRRAVIMRQVSIETVRAYLPSNYTARQDEAGVTLIEGTDDAGWTLDGYVIPRLASGMIFATEVTT